MKIFIFILTIVFLTPSDYAHAGIFGPSSLEECVLKGLKDAKNDAAVDALVAVCESKFSKSQDTSIVPECNVTWNGVRFVSGTPANRSRFISIAFPETADLVHMPEKMDKRAMRKVIEGRIIEIQKICPGIKVN